MATTETRPRDDARLTIAALALAPAIGLGIARFAYALILPDMRADLGWSYADAGWMNATNAFGYVAGALLAAPAINRLGAFRLMIGGALACIASLALCAVLRDFAALNAARLLAGVGGAFAFVAGSVLAVRIAQRDPRRAAFLVGLIYAGPGFGIVVSGAVVPSVIDGLGPGSWPWAWAALAALTLPMAVGLWRGRDDDPAPGRQRPQAAPLVRMAPMLAGYCVFGAGYIGYMTFMIAWVRDLGGGAVFQSAFWAVIGLGGMASPWLWAGLIGRDRHGRGFALLVVVTTIGAALPLASAADAALFASAALFGCSFFAVVATTTAVVRRNLPPAAWASGIGAMTVAFGAGQVIGPVAIGLVNDLTGGLDGGLWAATALLLAAAAIGLAQRDFKA